MQVSPCFRRHCAPHLVADKESEIEHQRITIIHVGKDREIRFGVRIELGIKPFYLWSDSNKRGTQVAHVTMNGCEGARVYSAVGAPMASVKGNDRRSRC